MAGLFGKLGSLGGLGGGSLGNGALRGAVTTVVEKVQGAGLPQGGSGAVTDAVQKVVGGLGLGDGLPSGDNSPGLFNGATTEQVTASEPVKVEFATGRFGLAVLSGDDAGNDDSTVSIDLLSFGNNAENGAPPASIGFGPEDATNLDVEILSGSYDSGGTGDIQIGPDIWGGGSPVGAHLLHDFNDPFSNDVAPGGNLADPITDGSLLNALAATLQTGDLLAA